MHCLSTQARLIRVSVSGFQIVGTAQADVSRIFKASPSLSFPHNLPALSVPFSLHYLNA